MTLIYLQYIIKHRKEGDFTKYCPICHHNFSDSFNICTYCGNKLISGENPNPIKINQYIPTSYIEEQNKINEKQQYQVKCPACGSPNVEKISAANKIGKAALLGVFSLGSIGKQFRCKNCGYKF